MNNLVSASWWNYVRDQELKPALEFFKNKNCKILEVGGGNGYQASKISEMGYDITSIDISPQNPLYFDVEKINVESLPFDDKTFDLIITSVVLQHLENLDSAFDEMKRVLKDDGLMIHLVPTYWWTIFTNFWHYCFIPKYIINSLIKKRKRNSLKNFSDNKTLHRTQTINSTMKTLFFHPLGNNPSFLYEIYYFRKNNWIKLFKSYSLNVIQIKNCPISSSGYAVFKNKFLGLRKFFGLYLCPTIICVVVKKNF